MRAVSEDMWRGAEDEPRREGGGRSLLRRLEAIDEDVIAVLLMILVVVVVLQIGSRFLFGRPFVWTVELALVLFVWLIFFGAVVGVRRKGLQAIDMVVKTFPPKLQALLSLAIHGLIIAFLMIIIWQGAILTWGSIHQIMPTTGLPRAALFVVVPFCGTLMLFYLLRQTVRLYSALRK